MPTEFIVREVFRLAGGMTVLACEGRGMTSVPAGTRAKLVGEGRVQSLSIVGERRMLNASAPPSHKALETRDAVRLSAEEARSGRWRLVLEE